MFTQDTLPILFTAYAFLAQMLLIFNFAALRWRPRIQQRWGWIVYTTGLFALPLGILFLAAGQRWYLGLAFVLLAVWAAFGYTVDILRPVRWRQPIHWQIFAPYVLLYISAQFAFWIPLWFIGPGYWIFYAMLYTISTALNVSMHFPSRSTPPL
ncbi:MAG: hypothetical protein ACM3QS_01560 [Bacteroidota bacterium]